MLTSIDFGSGIPGLNLSSIASYLCDLGQILSVFICKMDILVSTPHYFIGCCGNWNYINKITLRMVTECCIAGSYLMINIRIQTNWLALLNHHLYSRTSSVPKERTCLGAIPQRKDAYQEVRNRGQHYLYEPRSSGKDGLYFSPQENSALCSVS